MKKPILYLCIFTLLASSISHAQTIDSEKSVVNFTIKNLAFNKVNGTFKGMKGELKFDAATPSNSKFDVCIDATTINTDNNKRDEHLRSPDFFDTEQYPTICYQSTTISKTETGYQTKGKLTLHGITKEVKIPFTYTNNSLKGELEISRLNYVIGADTGKFMVGEMVTIEIICVFK